MPIKPDKTDRKILAEIQANTGLLDAELVDRVSLSQLPGVQDINSTVALSEFKYTTELPLGLI